MINNNTTTKYNVIKFQAPFEKVKIFSHIPEVRLYRSIILQAIIDASNTSSSRISKVIEQDAKDWIFNGNDNFIETCEMADLNPEYIKKISYQIIKFNARKVKL